MYIAYDILKDFYDTLTIEHTSLGEVRGNVDQIFESELAKYKASAKEYKAARAAYNAAVREFRIAVGEKHREAITKYTASMEEYKQELVEYAQELTGYSHKLDNYRDTQTARETEHQQYAEQMAEISLMQNNKN
jgi:uncharacterized coiled-coil DUF342 family protein